MLFKKKFIPAMFGAFVCLGLVACGSDSTSTVGVAGTTTADDPSGGTTGDTPTGSSSNSAHTIVLTYPYLDAITDEKGGVYKRLGKAIVTDNEGNPVPDGTEVYLNVIDSVLAKGTVDGATGAVLTDAAPLLGDGVTGAAFNTAYVYRNGAFHFIEAGDHVLLFNADEQDKNRLISSDTDAIGSTELTVASDYANTYPDATWYTAGSTSYVVGVSSLGAEVVGTDATGAITSTGYAETVNGVATFYVIYPAKPETLNTGCLGTGVDTRWSPMGSSDRVYVVASAGINATTIDSSYCFTSIAGWTIEARPTTTISGTSTLGFTIRDGGNQVRVPLVGVSTNVVTTGAAAVTLSNGGSYRSDEGGYFSSTITLTAGASGDTAVITYSAGDGSVDVTLTVP